MVWRVVRRLLAVFIQGVIVRPVFSLAAVVLVIGAAGLMIGVPSQSLALPGRVPTQNVAAASSVGTSVPVVKTATPVATVPAVNEYIQGMTTFNAQLIWNALDPTTIQNMTTQGSSEQKLQQNLDSAKQNGARYEGWTYVGGYPLQNGGRYLFYVASRRGFAGPNVIDQVFFVFTVGPNGKIVSIH